MLPAEHYGFNVSNQISRGVFSEVAGSFFSLGTNDTSHTTPFGIDGEDVTVVSLICDSSGTCYKSSSTSTYPLLTLSSVGQVYLKGFTIGVGSQPTAVKGYATSTRTQVYYKRGYTTTTEPSRAIVANFGSNTVNILNLLARTVVQTIPVGTEPTAVLVKSDNSKAYAANFGSSAISEIDLSTNSQSRVAAVGPQPDALTMDPSGTAIWVGGLNYISKVDLTSFSVVQTFSVSGQVTSVAVSAGQNALVYTTIVTTASSTTFQTQQASLTDGTIQGSYARQTVPSSSPYLAPSQYIAGGTSGSGSTAPPGWLLSSGALVSAPYGNRYAVTGTPTGFVVIDLQTRSQVLQGTTPSAVRGIATDPNNGIIYATGPDSNSLITVPFPPLQ